jgi:hypothetical protein
LLGLFVLRRLRGRDAIPLVAVLATYAVYFGFYYHALHNGVRLFADFFGPLSLLVAAGITAGLEAPELVDETGSKTRARLRTLHVVVSAACVALLVLIVRDEFGRDLPQRMKDIGRTRQAERVRNNLDAAGVHDAVVYVVNCIEPDRHEVAYGWASVLNATPPETGDRVYVRDFGVEHDRAMVNLFPTRRHVRVDCNGRVLESDFAKPDRAVVVTEMEAKFPPDERDQSYAILKPWPDAGNRAVLEIKVEGPGAWAKFRQHVFEDGAYQLELAYLRRPDGAKLLLVIDGEPVGGPIDTRGPLGVTSWSSPAARNLTAGTHRLEIRAVDGAGYLSLDKLTLRKQ